VSVFQEEARLTKVWDGPLLLREIRPTVIERGHWRRWVAKGDLWD